jgi:D-glycero-alpha-D-manno-heptose-7-phosphate kinase
MRRLPLQVRTFAPARLSLAGGGTDLAAFYHRQPGRVLSFAINLGVTVTATRMPGSDLRIVHLPDLGQDLWFEPGKHPTEGPAYLAALALDEWAGKHGCEVSIVADFLPGSGLGGSGAMCVALFAALQELYGRKWTPRIAAHEASRLEIELAGRPIGLQDQYASAFGGINLLTFGTNGKVRQKRIQLTKKLLTQFQQCLSLFASGVQRDSGTVLTRQKRATEAGAGTTLETLAHMAEMALGMSRALNVGDLAEVGRLLNEAWQEKKRLDHKISGRLVDEALAAAKEVGAWSGKVCGAGAGGHLLVMAPPAMKDAIQHAVSSRGYRLRKFSLDEFGVRIVTARDA